MPPNYSIKSWSGGVMEAFMAHQMWFWAAVALLFASVLWHRVTVHRKK